MTLTKHRRYVAHYLYTPSRGYLKLHGVEIDGKSLIRIFSFTEEMENAEWLPGIIKLEITPDHRVEIWHYYPFNFINMMPVFETQSRRLL